MQAAPESVASLRKAQARHDAPLRQRHGDEARFRLGTLGKRKEGYGLVFTGLYLKGKTGKG